MMMRHLLWKDGMTIKPLAQAILIAIVAIFFTLALTLAWFEPGDEASMYVSIWVLMPNLIALGAPAMLVGGEEESGTLSWLRTLPVSWQQVAAAKFMVALGAVAIAWLAASLCLFVVMASLVTQSTPYADSMLNIGGVCFLMFFSLLLLLCGFITAYLFRSPVVGLIAVVPLIAVLSSLSSEVGRWILVGDTHYRGEIHSAEPSGYLSAGMAGTALLIVAWILQRGLACRRLTSPGTNAINKLLEPESASAYRPPALVGASRPNQFVALLWQQLRQMGWFAVALTLIVAFFVVHQYTQFNTYKFGSIGYKVQDNQVLRFLSDLAPLFIAIGASWIGGLAFYGDNVRKRCAFFADRGVSPTRIWFTRVLFPILCCFVLVGLALLVGMGHRHEGKAIVVLIVVMLSFGQLVGQWMQRPVMTFLAAPAYTAVAAVILSVVLSMYSSYVLTAIWVAPVMLFASWRLCGRWLAGRVDFGYQWRVFAYTALAVSLPVAVLMGLRYFSTPELTPQWRAKMLAVQMPADADTDYLNGINRENISPDAYTGIGTSGKFANATADEKRQMLQQELDSERIGDHVSFEDINQFLNRRETLNHTLNQIGVAVLLKWAGEIRQHVADGRYTLWELERVAEPAEAAAVEALLWMTKGGTTPELAKLVESIPDRKLRTQSRRNGLITQWKLYNQEDWKNEYADGDVYYGKIFMSHWIAHDVARIPLERTRSDRFVDKATQYTLNQLEGTLPETTASPGFEQRVELWHEAISPPYVGGRNQEIGFGRYWTRAHEKHIDALRAHVAAQQPRSSR